MAAVFTASVWDDAVPEYADGEMNPKLELPYMVGKLYHKIHSRPYVMNFDVVSLFDLLGRLDFESTHERKEFLRK